jgi:hypothetical protein
MVKHLKPVKHVAKKAHPHAHEEPEPEPEVLDVEPEPEPEPEVVVPPPPPPPSAEEALAAAESVLRNLASQTTNRLGGGHGAELINAAAQWVALYGKQA